MHSVTSTVTCLDILYDKAGGAGEMQPQGHCSGA